MSEVNLNNLSSTELRDQAKILGVKVNANTADETIREKLREALGVVEEVRIKEEASEVRKMITIRIASDKTDKAPVFFGLNGRSIRVRRGENVDIPAEFLSVIRDAVQVSYDPETLEATNIPTYPVTIISGA